MQDLGFKPRPPPKKENFNLYTHDGRKIKQGSYNKINKELNYNKHRVKLKLEALLSCVDLLD